MGKRKLHKKMIMTRRRMIAVSIVILLFGLFFGWMIFKGFECFETPIKLNQSLCMIGFALLILIVWLPMYVAGGQVYDISAEYVRVIPVYKTSKRWQIIGYVLCNNTVEPFLRVIPLSSVDSCIFSVERRCGLYGMSRYTLYLRLEIKEEKLTIYINPIDNGVLLPSGKGGVAICDFKSREEIRNMVTFFEKNVGHIEDPYQLREMLKHPEIELYDYLEGQNIKMIY